jgi:hypothetical protein
MFASPFPNASTTIDGSFFPRRLARRKMPARAFTLNQNLRGTFAAKIVESVVTRGDDEDSPPFVRDPEPLGIKTTPCEAIPHEAHLMDESSEVPAPVGREQARDVLQHHPPRSSSFHKVEERECKAGSGSIGESPSRTGCG